MTAKKFAFNATSFVKTGEAHRAEQIPASQNLHAALSRRKPGKVPAFGDEPTARLNAFVPVRLLDKLQERAFREKRTISQIVADLLDKL
jgi:hypothetical protein